MHIVSSAYSLVEGLKFTKSLNYYLTPYYHNLLVTIIILLSDTLYMMNPDLTVDTALELPASQSDVDMCITSTRRDNPVTLVIYLYSVIADVDTICSHRVLPVIITSECTRRFLAKTHYWSVEHMQECSLAA